MLVVVAALTLSGCVRVQAALALSDRDTVSGQLVIASVVLRQDDKGPELTVPPELSTKVRATAYDEDGYVGNTVSFQELTFAETSLLTQTITTGSRYRLSFRRSGNLVTMSGSADLSELPADRADVQLKVAFPGTVIQTNGVNEGGTVSWTPKPGAVTEFTATIEYSDQSGVSWTKWVAVVGASAVGVALLVLVLALVTHRRDRRPAVRQDQ
ncbi:LppM family (lipo)protein [Actinokineospora sp. 24-640]